jgi:ClpP class serine protease
MSRQLLRITKALYNTPHLVTPDVLDRIEQYLLARNDGDVEFANIQAKEAKRNPIPGDDKTGFINVEGVLTYKSYFDMATCTENTSYQSIVSQFDTAVAAGYKTIILMVDSPGGEAYGAFETGRYLRTRSEELGIRLISYVDGYAASAAYIMASAAHEIIINPAASAGSIGVVVQLTNVNKALEKAGIERTFVYAGDNKIPFDTEGGWREDFLKDIQTKVGILYQEFVGYVAEMTGLSEEAIVSTQASMFLAQEAQEKGLVHKLMTRDEFNS